MRSSISRRLTIGTLAEAAGVGVETVRFYERKGLIARPPKPQRGIRDYPPEAVARIRFIREAQELGFTLKETAELLALRADPDADCTAVREQAEAKLRDVEGKARRLEAIREALETLIAACPGTGSTTACSILDALDRRSITPPGASARRTARRRGAR